jgi:predicted transcriptional regulator
MDGRSYESLGGLQRRVMDAVWELSEASVQQVREHVDPEQALAYTTVLSVMQKLEKQGWLRHRAQGRAYLYQPARSREQVGSGALGTLLEKVFGGDRLMMFQRLIDDHQVTDDELAALRKMIDQRRKERGR